MDRSAESSHENKRRPRRDDDLVEPLRNELALQSREERTPQHCDDPPQLRLNVFFVVVAMSLLASVDIRLLLQASLLLFSTRKSLAIRNSVPSSIWNSINRHGA